MARLTGDDLRAWVEASCSAQGVPVKVTDPMVVARVGVLLTGKGPGRPQAKRGGDGPSRSQLPDGVHSGGVEPVAGAGSDDGVVEDRGDDRALPVEGDVGPLVA